MKSILGNFHIKRLLAQGGMGEVFLAKDLSCNRFVAVKKIREDLITNKTIRERFLREAQLAAQLSHPSIIPIFSIYNEKKELYYSMPYIEGETLKEILKQTYLEHKIGIHSSSLKGSIPSLLRIFYSICQAVAYAHSKGVVHRDLKPENIMVGKFGEVFILDWGIAEVFDPKKKNRGLSLPSPGALTNPGKISGTLLYMSPERARGEKASPLSDIYSLGVILYQLLSLHLPFHRTSIASFRKEKKEKHIPSPQEKAPYRDIPEHLARIALQCLAPSPQQRVQSVEEILHEISHYLAGKFEWVQAEKLSLEHKDQWEFQENILLAKHIAITKEIDVIEWVFFMVSRSGFSGNTKMAAKVTLKHKGEGIGLLLSIPEAKKRKNLEEGYCLWISSEKKKKSKLYRNNVEVLSLPSLYLEENREQIIELEKVENNLHFYLDRKLIFTYLSHIPLTGTHVGLLFRDTLFNMTPLHLYTASRDAQISSLSVPDTLFTLNLYPQALSEYRKISSSFSGRSEGREALFRSGITLLEEAKTHRKKRTKKALLLSSLEEFSKLHNGPSAPLEYLGKSLVYKEMRELEEELKCLELALRKFPKHPLLPPIEEQILFRLHETSYHDRIGAYHFTLLTLLLLPHQFTKPDNQRLLTSLTRHWAPLPFLKKNRQQTALAIAFWLNKPLSLIEIAQSSPSDRILQKNVHYCLLYLGRADLLSSLTPRTKEMETLLIAEAANPITQIRSLLPLTKANESLLYYLINKAIVKKKTKPLLALLADIPQKPLLLHTLYIETLLWEKHWKKAQKEFMLFSKKELYSENHPLNPLYGCLLAATKGEKEALAFFTKNEKASSFSLPSLLGNYLHRAFSPIKALYWEKKSLDSQLRLFTHCLKK